MIGVGCRYTVEVEARVGVEQMIDVLGLGGTPFVDKSQIIHPDSNELTLTL